jgi:hypothetical protein
MSDDKIDGDPTDAVGASAEDSQNKPVVAAADDDNEEGEVFRLLTQALLARFELERAEHKQRVKEATAKKIVMKEDRLGERVVYEAVIEGAEVEDDDVLFEEHFESDARLEEGNTVPIKLGLIPKKLRQKPAIEIDPYIHKRYQTFIVLSKRLSKTNIYRFSSTNSLFCLTPINKLRRWLIWFATWQ